MTAAYGLAAALGIWACYLMVWGSRTKGGRISAVVLLALTAPAALAMEAVTLSRPMPISMEWFLASAEEATVLGHSIKEGEGIYLWLQVPGAEEPRYYVMPWDREAAQQLAEAAREAETNGQKPMMRMPFEPSLEDRGTKFYPPPQPKALPDKPEPPPAQVWEQPA